MEFTDLSLSRGLYEDGKAEIETGLPMKRKWNSEAPSVDLQLKTPLPSDWEQCLDLQSGRMYYVNRETSRKSWNRPLDKGKEKLELNLELNMMSSANTFAGKDEPSSNMVFSLLSQL
ncbi:WW domain containing protein [Striga asiatica]|uniref:WW domain containing protein n=1 Tax=Striga asiatica TaxID=4170 RepID=A0A5A7QCB4_STRAF|nr:WW domain containing protein [Striga asiatica]